MSTKKKIIKKDSSSSEEVKPKKSGKKKKEKSTSEEVKPSKKSIKKKKEKSTSEEEVKPSKKSIKKKKEKSNSSEVKPKPVKKTNSKKKEENSSTSEEVKTHKPTNKSIKRESTSSEDLLPSKVITKAGKKKEETSLPAEYLEGPVSFIYMKGDPGDGVLRKVLLLGDLHDPQIPCTSTSIISAANFFRYMAKRMSSYSDTKIIDIFIESLYDSGAFTPTHPEQEEKGQYLQNLRHIFRHCLVRNKSLCTEPMRIHYVDTRFIMNKHNSFSLHSLDAFLELILDRFSMSGSSFSESVRWPKKEEIEFISRTTISDARLTDAKLYSLHEDIRQKFKDVVITPLLQRIISFYRNTTNKEEFAQIQQIRIKVEQTKTKLTAQESVVVWKFKMRIILLMAGLVDAYFVYRLLKRATTRKAALPKLALPVGEATTQVIGYLGVAHTFGVRDILDRMGFEIISKEDKYNLEPVIKTGEIADNIVQCLSLELLRKSIDDFCKLE
jgi:hypothetical protein